MTDRLHSFKIYFNKVTARQQGLAVLKTLLFQCSHSPWHTSMFYSPYIKNIYKKKKSCLKGIYKLRIFSVFVLIVAGILVICTKARGHLFLHRPQKQMRRLAGFGKSHHFRRKGISMTLGVALLGETTSWEGMGFWFVISL